MKKIILLFISATFFAISASANNNMIKIGLAYSSTSLPSANLLNYDGEGYKFGYFDDKNFIELENTSQKAVTISQDTKGFGTKLSVANTETGEVLFEYNGNLGIMPMGKQTWFKGYKYGGGFEYRISDKNVSVINVIDLEEYVKGVVPYEVSTSWHIEALKAQTLAARSYAVGNFGKHKKYGFDVCNTTDCQVYKGTNSATEKSDLAVNETKGEYITYNNKTISAFFHSSNGGSTENSENVWSTAYPYLKAVPDNFEDLEKANNGRWETYTTNEQIERILKSKGVKINGVKNMYIGKFTPSGNVLELVIVDDNDFKHIYAKEKARTILNSSSEKVAVHSMRYTIESGNNVGEIAGDIYIGDTKVSPNSSINIIGASGNIIQKSTISGNSVITSSGTKMISSNGGSTSNSGYTIKGTGWGHNVGMSQNGAKAMAEKGYKYDEIIKYYFTGVDITKIQ